MTLQSPSVGAPAALPARAFVLAIGLFCAINSAAAQTTETISGHVSAGNMPLRDASVRLPQLNLGGTTDADGRYSFIVPSSRVRGQTVSLVARHVRFADQSVDIVLVGGSLVQDFNLSAASSERPVAAKSPTPSTSVTIAPVVVTRQIARVGGRLVDSTAFDEAAGPLDLSTAIAGRVPGLTVRSDAALGGSSSIVLRGSRSIAGASQPLIVVDGIPIDNSTVTTSAQRFGFGGLDYGTAIQDLNLGDIATVRVLEGISAAAAYGDRGANGVILVTTKSGRGLNGFDVSASQQVTADSPVRLPSYQNSYGQGSGGQFEFFNGRGGGVNDGVAESWGPALQGQAIAQASLVQSGKPDVRAWLAAPNNVSDYFDRGRTLTTDVAAQGSYEHGGFRASLNNRDFAGLTPGSSVTRRGGTVTATAQPTAPLALQGTMTFASDEGSDLAGTGFDESNPVAEFSRFGRQVDIAALRTHLRDASGNQISWNYAGQNNPFFQSLENSNDNHGSRWMGGAGADYQFTSWLAASLHGGADHFDATRNFDVASGWMGGFPDASGRGDFSAGGSQAQFLSSGESNLDVVLRAEPHGALSPMSFAVGANLRANSLTNDATIRDSALTAPASASSDTVLNSTTTTHAHSLFASARFAATDYATATFVVRNEWSSVFAPGHDSNLYPAASLDFDVKRALSGAPAPARDVNRPAADGSVTAAVLHAGWSKSGTDLTRYDVQNTYSGYQAKDSVSLAPAPAVNASPTLGPETTTNLEFGGRLGLFNDRVGVDLTYYRERTNGLIVAEPSGPSFVATNGGSLTNAGVEGAFNVDILRRRLLTWQASVVVARNDNTVQSLNGGASSIALTPSRFGVDLEARTGQPLGVIVGDGFLRNQSGALILANGLPLPDTLTGPKTLGDATPSWTGALSNRITYGWLEVSALVDASFGGRIFGATNMLGATSGVLAETAFRPDSGLLIAGVDATSGQANTQHVTTEAYYHALRLIPERWVYDASFAKLREARATATVPARFVPGFRVQTIRVSLIGRNLWMWANAPNIDPEMALSAIGFQGLELGQLPTVRSVGVQLTITP